MFKAYLEGGWKAITNGADLSSHVCMYGKPTQNTFAYAEKALLAYHRKINGPNASRVKTIYMVSFIFPYCDVWFDQLKQTIRNDLNHEGSPGHLLDLYLYCNLTLTYF